MQSWASVVLPAGLLGVAASLSSASSTWRPLAALGLPGRTLGAEVVAEG